MSTNPPVYIEFYICSEPSITIPDFTAVQNGGNGKPPQLLPGSSFKIAVGTNVSSEYDLPPEILTIDQTETVQLISQRDGSIIDVVVSLKYNALQKYDAPPFIYGENGVGPSTLPLPYTTPPLGTLLANANFNNLHCEFSISVPANAPQGIYDIVYTDKATYDSLLAPLGVTSPLQVEVAATPTPDITLLLALAGIGIIAFLVLK